MKKWFFLDYNKKQKKIQDNTEKVHKKPGRKPRNGTKRVQN